VRRIAALGVLLLLVAGCASEDSSAPPVRELRAWEIPQDVFIPNVPRVPKPKAAPAPAPAAAPEPGDAPSPGAPSDAEIRAELKALYGEAASTSARAVLLRGDGLVSAPPDAPAEVQAIVSAANQVAKLPYVYGGGHGRGGPEGLFVDSAYDCSGSVSFAFASAGLLKSPLDSTGFMRWGKPGPGKWVTVYANAGHAFMVVGGVRFDTSGLRESGSRWQTASRTVSGFTVRHPPGL
jgi:cell wall-associated NlpC family hydrolase